MVHGKKRVVAAALSMMATLAAYIGCGEDKGSSNASSGGNLAAAGSGGTKNSSGGTHAGGAFGNGTAEQANTICTAFVARESALCGPLTELDVYVAACVEDWARDASMGCGGAWLGWLDCATTAEWDCTGTGPLGCDTVPNDYMACESQFAARTGCPALGPRPDWCESDQEGAFTCLTQSPPWPECRQVQADSGSMAYFYCCPWPS